MPMCEKCWTDAYGRSLADTRKGQAEHYEDLVQERDNGGQRCTPRQQAGQWWSEELKRDSRIA